MQVFIVTRKGYEETIILGVYSTKELAQEHIDWCVNTSKGRDRLEQYEIVVETVFEK